MMEITFLASLCGTCMSPGEFLSNVIEFGAFTKAKQCL